MSESAQIRLFVPGPGASAAEQSAIRDLVVQPSSPWFSDAERRHFEGALSGEFTSIASDRFWVAWIDGKPVAHACFTTAAGTPETGLLAFVITAPEYRGRGLGRLVLDEVLADFVALGGECLQLGTGNPTAHRLYESRGFRDYSGHVMRFLACPGAWDDFDRCYFANLGPAHIRAAHWGDSARIAMLYTSPHPWFVRDYPERLYSHPAAQQTRCASILPALMIATGSDDSVCVAPGGFWVLENAARRIVGAATLRALDQTAQAQVPVVDFLIAPGYLDSTAFLLNTAIEAARSHGARLLRACVAGCDMEKAGALQAVGFHREATLADQLAAGADAIGFDHFDLHVHTLALV